MANNLFELGEGASLYSVVGRDDGGHRFLSILGDGGESAQFVAMDPERKTTVKQRWVADDRQIARADFEASTALGRTVGPTREETEACCRELQERLDCENVVLTLSKDGIALLDREGNFAMLPAMIRFVHDAAGAGDTVIGVLAAAMAAGASLQEAVTLANLAGGVICEKVGVQPVTVEEIRHALAYFSAERR